MGYHPRIEDRTKGAFLTTRARNSELWFVNNSKLEDAILGYAAKYQNRYSAVLYALAIEGSHIQSTAAFPSANRAQFMRDFNSSVARAVPRYVDSYPGGRFWERRYSQEFVPEHTDDIEERFFYTVLQPIQDGLVEKISRYKGYNCFHDAIHGISRSFYITNWTKYNDAKRKGKNPKISEYREKVTLNYTRLPGYEHLSKKEYVSLMLEKFEERRKAIVAKRYAEGKGFAREEDLDKTRPGALPKSSKRSDRYTHRPRVLSVCAKRRKEMLAWYFEIYFTYKEASLRYQNGELHVEFPPGTYKPYVSLTPPQQLAA